MDTKKLDKWADLLLDSNVYQTGWRGLAHFVVFFEWVVISTAPFRVRRRFARYLFRHEWHPIEPPALGEWKYMEAAYRTQQVFPL